MNREILPPEAFTELERRDEAQIMAELEGTYLKEFVYQFQIRGRTVTGISWAGIKEIAYRMGRITIDLIRMEETDQAWIIVVKATDAERGSSRLGISTQSKMMKRRQGPSEPDPFSLQKAMSKAQRNAIRPLIPEEMLKTWITKFLEMRKGGGRKLVEAKQAEKPEAPTPTNEKPLNLNILYYNLKAFGISEEDISVWETSDSFIIEPARDLTEKEHADIDWALTSWNAVWEERVGLHGRWRISKEA